ncbi:MAG: SurA N-terminal domain-containing protein [Vampirovibrionales bacterium]
MLTAARCSVNRFSPFVLPLVMGWAVLATTLLTGCLPMANQQPVVTINNHIVVTRGEYETMTSQLMAEANLDPKQFNHSTPQQGVLAEQIKQAVLNKLIFNALLKDAAKKQGIVVTDQQYQAFRKKQVDLLGGEENLKYWPLRRCL